jgi:hypothetical protein
MERRRPLRSLYFRFLNSSYVVLPIASAGGRGLLVEIEALQAPRLDLLVTIPRLRATQDAVRGRRQPVPVPAHPTLLPGRDADHQSVVGHVRATTAPPI